MATVTEGLIRHTKSLISAVTSAHSHWLVSGRLDRVLGFHWFNQITATQGSQWDWSNVSLLLHNEDAAERCFQHNNTRPKHGASLPYSGVTVHLRLYTAILPHLSDGIHINYNVIMRYIKIYSKITHTQRIFNVLKRAIWTKEIRLKDWIKHILTYWSWISYFNTTIWKPHHRAKLFQKVFRW